MIDFDLDRLFEDDDYPAVEVTRSLNAVDQYLKLLDEYLPHIRDQTMVRFAAEFERKRPYAHSEDLELDLEGIKQLTGETVPLFFYGSFVIALWAAFESSLNDLSGYIRKKESAPLKLADLREPNTRRKLELFMETVMRRPLSMSEAISERIEGLQLVRNCLAHANGDLRQQRESRRREIEALAAKDIGVSIDTGRVIVNGKFAHACLDAVVSYVNLLFERIHAAYPLSAAKKVGANPAVSTDAAR